jgi:hypothetical protein
VAEGWGEAHTAFYLTDFHLLFITEEKTVKSEFTLLLIAEEIRLG